jgi:serine/threonine protein kinase
LEDFKGTDRFAIRRRLGAGVFGTVFEAFDHERQIPVALKVPAAATAHNLLPFKHEFRALAELAHPNLANLFEVMSHGQDWFFTMELVDGPNFYGFLCPGDTSERRARAELSSWESDPVPSGQGSLRSVFGRDISGDPGASPVPDGADGNRYLTPAQCFPPADYGAVRLALRQLVEGVAALHQFAKLHRNLKPNNVRIAADGRVVLLDCGLSPDLLGRTEDAGPASLLAGTPAYMAPERIGGQAASEACDWYGVGAMLYQVLTGQLPFPGGSLATIINKMRVDPIPPRELVPGTPADLDAICVRLLQRMPELRPTGAQILAAVGGLPPRTPAPAPPAPPRPPVSNLLIGREAELEVLGQAFADSQRGLPVIAFVHGRSGLGKSFLLRRFIRDLLRAEPAAVVLEGRCYQQDPVPYKALGSLVGALAQHLAGLDPARATALLPRNIQSLARLFPALLKVPAVAAYQGAALAPDPQELRRRAFSALRELLGRIGDRCPLLLLIDNLQWIDPDSVALLVSLFRSPAPPAILILASFCTGDGGRDQALEALKQELAEAGAKVAAIAVQDLPSEEGCRLAQALLGPDFGGGRAEVAAEAARISTEAGGNAFFIGELVRLVKSGADRGGEGSLAGYLRSRIALLAGDQRRVLETLALAGRPLPWEVLVAACRLPAGGIEAQATLRAEHFLRIRNAAGCEVYHDRTREALLAGIGPDQARALHLALAEALAAWPEPDIQALAMHYRAAGVTERAAEYALAAARSAVATLAFQRGADLFRQVLELRPPAGAAATALLTERADALAHGGQGSEAAEVYLRAAAGAGPREARRLRHLAVAECFRCGRFELGVATLGTLLGEVGMRLANRPGEAWAQSLWFRTRVRMRGLGFAERRADQVEPAVLDRIDLCWAAVMGLGAIDAVQGWAFQARQLLLALEAGEPGRIVRALAQETLYASYRGNRGLAATRKLQEATLALAERTGEPAAQSRAWIAVGGAALMLGRFREAGEALGRAEALLRENCTGLENELHLAQFHALLSQLFLGNLRELEVRYPSRLQSAREKGNLLAVTHLRTTISPVLLLAQDEPGRANREVRQALADWPSPGYHSQHFNGLCALVNIQLYGGNLEGAMDLLQAQWKRVRRSHLLRVQVLLVTGLELRVRTALALAMAAAPGSRKRRALLKAAHEDLRRLEAEGTAYGEALALKLQGMEALVRFRQEEAAALYFQAEMAFQGIDMALHAAVMRYCRGQLEGPSGADHVEAALCWMRNQGISNPTRFVAMHVPNMGPGLEPLAVL